MVYSYFDYDGTGTSIQTNIQCISTEHMYAFLITSEEDDKVMIAPTALSATFTKTPSGVLCELKNKPTGKVRVIRSTPYNTLIHDFSNGAQFHSQALNEVYLQQLYLYQEIVEGKLIIDRVSASGGSGSSTVQAKPEVDITQQLQEKYTEGYNLGKLEANSACTISTEAAVREAVSSKEQELNTQHLTVLEQAKVAEYNRGYQDGRASSNQSNPISYFPTNDTQKVINSAVAHTYDYFGYPEGTWEDNYQWKYNEVVDSSIYGNTTRSERALAFIIGVLKVYGEETTDIPSSIASGLVSNLAVDVIIPTGRG